MHAKKNPLFFRTQIFLHNFLKHFQEIIGYLSMVSCKFVHIMSNEPYFKEEKEGNNGNDEGTHDEGIPNDREKIRISHFLNDYPCQRSDKSYNRCLHFILHQLRIDERLLLKSFDSSGKRGKTSGPVNDGSVNCIH